jgi:hypothetical protein
MTVENIYRIMAFIAKDNGSSMTRENYNNLLDFGNATMYSKYISEYEKTKRISKALSPFVVSSYLDFNGGLATLPVTADYVSEMSYWYASGGTGLGHLFRMGEELKESEVAERSSDAIKMPTTKNPCYVRRGRVIYVYPPQITRLYLTYITVPTTPYYDVSYDSTTDINLRYATTTVEIAWDSDFHVEFINIMLQHIGINLSDQAIMQYSIGQEQKGDNKLNT